MIREITYNKKDYIVIYTTLTVERENTTATVPVHVKVDITSLSEKDRTAVYRKVYILFNRAITLKEKQAGEEKKPWWKALFN